jgi:LAGLIDADG endonuclease
MLESPCIPRYSFGNQTSQGVCEPSSENPSDADNQQERLIKIGWITGFVDGEGCFSIHFVRQPDRANRKGYRTGFQVAHQFAVTQGARGVECLNELKAFFGMGGLLEIVEITQTMNHCKPRTEMIRILRDYTPNTDHLLVGEDIVRSAWRHAG